MCDHCRPGVLSQTRKQSKKVAKTLKIACIIQYAVLYYKTNFCARQVCAHCRNTEEEKEDSNESKIIC